MGSGSSKTRRFDGAGSSCSSFSSAVSSVAVGDDAGSTGSSRRRLRARRVFRSSCLGSTSRTCDSDDDGQMSSHHTQENGGMDCSSQIQRADLDEDAVKIESYRNTKGEQPGEMTCVSPDVDLSEWIQENDRDDVRSVSSRPSSASSTQITQPVNLSSRLHSCFNFVPGNVSFRLSRASSLHSVRANPVSPANYTVSNEREESHLPARASIGSIGRNDNRDDDHLRSTHFSRMPPRQYYRNSPGNLFASPPTSASESNSQDYCPTISTQSLAGDDDSLRVRGDAGSPYARNHSEMHSGNTTHVDWRNAPREPTDHNFRFSRTLSVGRLRDRVLRRPSLSDLTLSPLQPGTLAADSTDAHGLHATAVETRTATSDEDHVASLATNNYHMYSGQNSNNEASPFRESRLYDFLHHRSNFLERQRRIRSRVRALQRSRFETLSGHERSCISSGYHRTGQCTCLTNTRVSNTNDDTGARASISRIVMLAEALFEVLDEIHQQSMALPSRPSVSSIGSVPAPSEVVECLPLKIYSKSTKVQNDEAGQCYICLVEYEDGDNMRVLPCRHEFHKACVDKWLKEIHRVCPLCRGDICRSHSIPMDI